MNEEESNLIKFVREYFERRERETKECSKKGHPNGVLRYVNNLNFPTFGNFYCYDCMSSYDRLFTQKERDERYDLFHTPMSI